MAISISIERVPEEYAEVPQERSAGASRKIVVEQADRVADADRAIAGMRKGFVVMFNLRELRTHNMDEMKACVMRVKKAAGEQGYNMAFLDDNWLLLLPPQAVIEDADPQYVRNAAA